MSIIVNIEEAIKARLSADITGVPALVKMMPQLDGSIVEVPIRIESYPRNPSEQSFAAFASSGALVVRYTGSRYSRKRVVGTLTVQDRVMLYEVQVFSESLQARDSGGGIYELLDMAAARLIGYTPAGCVDGGELERDDYVDEVKGAWAYGLLVNVKTQIESV